MKDRPEDDETPEASALARILDSLDEGDYMTAAGDDLREVVEAVDRTGSAGSITLKIAVERKAPGKFILKPAPVAVKIPRDAPAPAIRYLDGEAILTASDPAQAEFDFGGKVTRMDPAAEAEG